MPPKDQISVDLCTIRALPHLLDDDDVWEIMVNAPDAIFVKRHVGQSGYHGEAFHDDEHVIRTLTKLLDQSSASHRKLVTGKNLVFQLEK